MKDLTERDLDFLYSLVKQYIRKREKGLAKMAPDHHIRPRIERNLKFASMVLNTLDRQKKGSAREGGLADPEGKGITSTDSS